MICKISGKPTGTKIPHLHVNNSEVTDIPDIANSLTNHQTLTLLAQLTITVSAMHNCLHETVFCIKFNK